MENPEEILHSLEEFSKLKPKDIPRELEDYLCFVAKTGDPVYQWGTIKSLLREKLINVITDFYESCPSVEIPPCPNVEVFNYESMKTFILDKLDTFPAAPFTVQRICELLTSPRKQYNRIDKYMRALEKNILVVSTTEPGFRRTTENGDGIVNGLEADHLREASNVGNDINVEEMDESPVWPRLQGGCNDETNANTEIRNVQSEAITTAFCTETRSLENNCISTVESVITCRTSAEQPYVSIEPVVSDTCAREDNVQDSDVTVTITAIPAAVQKRRDSIEPVVSSANETLKVMESDVAKVSDHDESTASPSSTETNPTTENMKCPPSESIIETSVNDGTSDMTNMKDDSEQLNIVSDESAPLIQIPIISEISSGVLCEESQEADAIIPIKVDDKSDTENIVDEQIIDPISDTVTEVSTTVTSTIENDELKTVICENNTVVSPASQETSVSSTDDLSNDASDILNVNRDETCEAKTYISEDSLTDCIADTNSGIAIEETGSNNSDEAAFNNEGYASSSTSRDSMDIDIGEETCQEAATSGD